MFRLPFQLIYAKYIWINGEYLKPNALKHIKAENLLHCS